MRRVVVNADDLGLAPEVNAAIARAHDAGTVTSATLLVNAAAAEDAAALARARPALSVGLHFNLTLGRPLAAEVGSLVAADGTLLSRRALLARCLSGRVRRQDVELELEAQLEEIGRLGIRPTHVDGHQHVQVLPVVARAVGAVARRRGLPVRIPWVHWRPTSRRLAARVGLAAADRLAAGQMARILTPAFASVFDYDREALGPHLYGRMVREVRGGTLEIMVHPTLPSVTVERVHPAHYPVAVQEGRALLDPETRRGLDLAGARLVSVRELSVP